MRTCVDQSDLYGPLQTVTDLYRPLQTFADLYGPLRTFADLHGPSGTALVQAGLATDGNYRFQPTCQRIFDGKSNLKHVFCMIFREESKSELDFFLWDFFFSTRKKLF